MNAAARDRRLAIDTPPSGTKLASMEHRVSFYETDAMGVVHHSNFLRYFELARVKWLKDYDQPYTAYMESGLNFATTRSEADYIRSARFDEALQITTWMQWVRGASLRMEYLITSGDQVVAKGATEHAAVSRDGRVRRIPAERRRNLHAASAEANHPPS